MQWSIEGVFCVNMRALAPEGPSRETLSYVLQLVMGVRQRAWEPGPQAPLNLLGVHLAPGCWVPACILGGCRQQNRLEAVWCALQIGVVL